MSNKIRIQNARGEDIVIIDMNTGKVTFTDEGAMYESAVLWWNAVATAYEGSAVDSGKSFKDLIIKAAGVGDRNDGDLILQPGPGGCPRGREEGGRGGDIVICDTETASIYAKLGTTTKRARKWE